MSKLSKTYILENLKFFKAMKGWTQEEFANQLGWKRATFANYISGNTKMPPIRILEVAQFFGVTTDDFMGRDLKKDGASPKSSSRSEVDAIAMAAMAEKIARLEDYIKTQGGDDIAADNALDKGIKELRSNIGKG